jgi:hypothetical protein
VLLVEYGKAQDSAEHHDNLVSSIASLNWVGSAVLLGFVIGRVGGTPDWKEKIASVGLAVLGLMIAWFVWNWAQQQADVKRQKYDRCKEIERELGMRQHSALAYPSRYMQRGFAALTLFLGVVWLVLVVLILLS